MNPLRLLLPKTLFGRAVLTLVFTFALFAVITLGSVIYYALLPVAQRSADDLVSFMLLSAQSWVMVPPNQRSAYTERVLDQYKIWIQHTYEPIPENHYYLPYVSQVEASLKRRLGFAVPVRTQVIDGRRWFFADLKFGQQQLRLGFPRDRIKVRPWTGLMVVGLFTLSLVLVTATVLARGITRPLTRLAAAARQMALGESPEPLPEKGSRELASLARQFNHLGRQVEELLASRTTLLSGISHDLRTPLTRLRLVVEMLPPDTDPKLQRRMRDDLEQMDELINDALGLARGLGAKESKRVDLGVLVDGLVENRPRLHWHNPGSCEGDVNPAALRRILSNLLENALRYSGGESVEIELLCYADGAEFRILDRGPGIPETMREAVFRPFVRLEESRSKETGGSGLGLAIVRQLADCNGYTVSLEQRDGGGTMALVAIGKPEPYSNRK